MLTTKQVIEILAYPLSYSRATRLDAAKRAIEILDEIALAKDTKEPTDAADTESVPVSYIVIILEGETINMYKLTDGLLRKINKSKKSKIGRAINVRSFPRRSYNENGITVRTCEVYDILWEDGEIEKDICAHELIAI